VIEVVMELEKDELVELKKPFKVTFEGEAGVVFDL